MERLGLTLPGALRSYLSELRLCFMGTWGTVWEQA